MANSVDLDQMPHSVASDLGLHCLQWPICPNTKEHYGIPVIWSYKSYLSIAAVKYIQWTIIYTVPHVLCEIFHF